MDQYTKALQPNQYIGGTSIGPPTTVTIVSILEQLGCQSMQLSERMLRIADSLGGAIPRASGALQGNSEKNLVQPSVIEILRYISSTLETALNDSERAQSLLGNH